MKILSFKMLCLLPVLLSAVCYADDGIALSRDIEDSLRAVKDTSLDNAYLSLDVKDSRYYAGFTIEKDGSNQPTLVAVDKDNGKKSVWQFDDIIADVFVFDSQISVVLDSGAVYSLNDDRWKKSSLVLGERSRIIFSDGKLHLIACTPSSLFKEDTKFGGCKSHNPIWEISFPWHDMRPKVCGDLLYAVTWERKQNKHLAVNLESGEIVHHEVYRGKDVCVQFPVE